MSYSQLLYHIVFRTKHSVQAIPLEHEDELYRYIWSVLQDKGCVLYRIGGMPDHIHMLVQVPPTITISDLIRDIKANSSRVLKEHSEQFPNFLGWGKSFCAISITYNDKQRIIDYIKNQKQHHAIIPLKDEIPSLLQDAGIPIDPKYFFYEE